MVHVNFKVVICWVLKKRGTENGTKLGFLGFLLNLKTIKFEKIKNVPKPFCFRLQFIVEDHKVSCFVSLIN